jgi:SAM-dependent methyltransferase
MQRQTEMNLVERSQCPLCGSAESGTHIAFPRIPVDRCGSCGFLFSSRIMADEAMTRYYAESFGSERHRQGQIVNARINRWASRALLGDVMSAGRSLVDVGSGYGYFLDEVQKRFGMETVGVELSQQEARHARERLKLDVRDSIAAASVGGKRRFDVVTSFEVIEHVPDPRSFVRELASLAKPGGHLLLMTDNFESDVVRKLGPGFPKWIPHSHISHFGPSTLERLVSECGFAVRQRLSYTPWEVSLRYAYYAARGIRKTAEASFDLDDALRTEMTGHFRLFGLRRAFNPVWARLRARRNLDAAQIYVLAER